MGKTGTALLIGGGLLATWLLLKGKSAQGASGSLLGDILGGGNGNSELGAYSAPDEFKPYNAADYFTKGQAYVTSIVDQIFNTGKASSSPLDLNAAGIYPALDINEAGLFVNRTTGEVYPVDPTTGRQRARIENGEVVGRFIANEQGIPYGSYDYETIPVGGIKKTYSEEEFGLKSGGTVTIKPMYGITKASGAVGGAQSVLVTSKATGQQSVALVGTNPSTGAGYVWYGTGW